MTVHHYGAEVDVLGGDVDEGWAIVQHPEKDHPRDVEINSLKASNGFVEIADTIEDRADFMGEEFDVHLPLEVNITKDNVRICTVNREYLLDARMGDIIENAEDVYEAQQETTGVVRMVSMAHRQPKRFIFLHRDKLTEVKA